MGEGAHLPLATSNNIMDLLHKGFQLGAREAPYIIATQHLDGKHAKKDDEEGFKYLFIAGRLGNSEARKQAMIMRGLQREGFFMRAQEQVAELLDELESKMVRFR